MTNYKLLAKVATFEINAIHQLMTATMKLPSWLINMTFSHIIAIQSPEFRLISFLKIAQYV